MYTHIYIYFHCRSREHGAVPINIWLQNVIAFQSIYRFFLEHFNDTWNSAYKYTDTVKREYKFTWDLVTTELTVERGQNSTWVPLPERLGKPETILETKYYMCEHSEYWCTGKVLYNTSVWNLAVGGIQLQSLVHDDCWRSGPNHSTDSWTP